MRSNHQDFDDVESKLEALALDPGSQSTCDSSNVVRTWVAGRTPKAEREELPKADSAKELPIFAHRDVIIEHVRRHRVTHIQGETGCGKSTQVPKYIMEDAEAARATGLSTRDTKIVVTQPRRMAAISLAKRCAAELGEQIGKTVGYRISGDSVSGKLSFATTGFLLQVLVNQPEEFGSYTHVILDEVHERSVDADLLTMLLKLLMQCYPKVKLIVMSATLQAHLFAEYFAVLEENYIGTKSRVPQVAVKPLFVGVRTFPVEQIFLDELDDHFEIEDSQSRRSLAFALQGFQRIGKGKEGKGKSKGKGKKADRGIDGGASGFQRSEPKIVEGLDMLCRELIQQLARELCTLIVFLPGIADITAFYETLAPLDSSRRADESSWSQDRLKGSSVSLRIFPMHSMIPREEQEEVFNPPPKGVCHVVLASNVAESSLTLPSVCAVIDMGLRRSIEYDARRLMSCLITTWCSQSSCRQRSGRAGRTMPGRAVRMVTRQFFEEEMVEFDPPEMLSAPLTKLYLQAKQLCYKLASMHSQGIIPKSVRMDLTTPTSLLEQLVQPPTTTLIGAAIRELADVGAIDRPSENCMITPLGYIAMALPCDLRLCRLICFGLMLHCPADAIAMVAGLTAADPFSAPSLMVLKDEREYCKKLERSFEARTWCDRGRHSEPLMLRELFMEWINAGAPRGPKAMGAFARDWNVIPKKFEAVTSEAVDLATRLCKLLKPNSPGHADLQRLLATMRFHVDKREELVLADFPSNLEYRKVFCENVTLMRALLACSFSDQLLVHLKPRWEPSGGKKRKEEQMVATMKKHRLDNAGTVVVMQPPQKLRVSQDISQTEENVQKVCEAICGERAQQIHWDEKEKLLFIDFVGKTTRRRVSERPPPCGWRESDPVPILQDVAPQAHRFHQFGAGRWKFTVENPVLGDGEMEMLELVRPVQPFLINWEVMQHQGLATDATQEDMQHRKPEKVKAMPDWRNPLGFACDVRPEVTPAREHIGVCASVQGLESGQSAFVAGATVLGMNHFPLVMATIDPVKWNLKWGFDKETEEVVAVKVMHFEINLPPETITADVLWKVNQLRAKMRAALSPSPEIEREGLKGHKGSGKHRGKGPAGGFIDFGDIRQEMTDLLEEIWDEPDPCKKAKQIRWGSGATEQVGYEECLALLQPLAEDLIPVTEQARLTKKQMKEKNKARAKAEAEAKAKEKPKPAEYTVSSGLSIGDRASLSVNYGKFAGTHTVTIVSSEEKGWKVKHVKDGFEEVIKQRDINSGKLSLTAVGAATPKAKAKRADQWYQ
eukprot:TRINITY_DN90857_c0_g1_i1.p1 TRINITY_DN90857_c0_g1~~TRINITY_DN90857_c0_g1_i1.p1  ORF type:complete len:1288 (-),score=243.86 TRINITY_DN90857_c0_g1_i1:42-3905(-)